MAHGITPDQSMSDALSDEYVEDEHESAEEDEELEALKAQHEKFKATCDANLEDQSTIIKDDRELTIDLSLASHSSIYFYCTLHRGVKYGSTEERYYGYAYQWASHRTLADFAHWLTTSYRERLQMRAIEVEAGKTWSSLPEANEVVLPDVAGEGSESTPDRLARVLNLCIFGERYEVMQLRRDCLYTYANAITSGEHANEQHIALVYENAPWYWLLRNMVAEDFLRRDDLLDRSKFDLVSNAMSESRRTELMLKFVLDVATHYESKAYHSRLARKKDDVSWSDEMSFPQLRRLPSPDAFKRRSPELNGENGHIDHNTTLEEDCNDDDDISLE